MKHGIHFIAGLPRSGSTLLAAILRQNPRFHAGMSSPLATIYMAMQTAVSRRTEGAMFLDDDQKQALLKGVFENYYHRIGEDRVVFDTNRIWCARMDHIAAHYPDAKVICCVRHVSWVLDSIERLVRRNIYDLSGIFGFEPGGTVYTRVTRLAASDGLVGFAIDALREAFHGGHRQRLLLVDGPSVLGWHAWRTVDLEFGLGLLRRGREAAAASGQLALPDVETTTHLLAGALIDGAMVIGRNPEDASLRRSVEATILRFVTGLTGPSEAGRDV